MQKNTVSIDTSVSPAKIEYSAVFNVAVPFIDRHLDEGRKDKVIIRTTGGEEVTFGELAERVNQSGNVLIKLGLHSGDRLLMMVKDSPEFFYLFWGAIKAGIVPVPLNTLLRAKDYAFMIEDSGAAAVIYSPEFQGEVEPALEQLTTKPEIVLLTEGESGCFLEKMNSADSNLEAAPASATDDCFWLYSSGTTGRPKGAVHSHRDMIFTSQHYGNDTLGVRENDLCFSAAKLFFAYGLGNGMTFPLWAGASCVLFPARPTPETTFEVIERFKPTLYFGVPTLYAAQLQALESAESESSTPDFSSLRMSVSAGEALPADIFRRWKEQSGTVILDGIGSTEALHIFISNRADDIKAGSSGRMVPGYAAKIVDEQGNEVSKGEEGRLLIQGDSSCKYYWNNPEKTAATIVDGWLNTGDTYHQDEEGYYVYGGRSDDMMKVGGIWCSPFEIEAKLVEHPKVLEAAVVGREDDSGLIKPEAHVVLKAAADATDETSVELLQHCKKGLAPYKYPRWFQFPAELPKTATGKIQRFKLRSK
ncbi:MAG: benzoate-CoA ligase family protein [SAR324 cluster bacterium]|nr:benzoate-CoA ligase family protein [SAR324 cluster bacterium]